MDMRQTVDEGMYRMFRSETLSPDETQISMDPMPTAWVELPPKPFTLMEGIGWSDLKLERSGDT